MSLIAKSTTFTPAPEGMHRAVCVDVKDLGLVDTKFGKRQHRCQFVWELEAKMADGRPFLISKSYNVSLHEKSALYKDLRSWRGKAFTAEELAEGFDLEKVLGAPCSLVVAHVERDGITYANIQAIVRVGKKDVIKPSGKYVRFKDRNGAQAQDADDDDEPPLDLTQPPEPDTLPF